MEHSIAPSEPNSPEVLLALVGDLATAAEQAALVRLALSSTLLQRCVDPIGEGDLARLLDTPVDRLSAVCDALVALGALDRQGASVRLSPEWAPLARDGVHVTLERALAGAAARTQTIETSLEPSPVHYWQVDPERRRDLADGITLATTTEFGRSIVAGVLDDLPEIADELRDGARWLELGCGVAGMLLGALHAYPRLTAVGVDLDGGVLDVARARAVELDVADRVRFVQGDAATHVDDEPFDVVFWSQFFFPVTSRSAALSNAVERLRPGGVLLCPVVPGDLEPIGSRSTVAQQGALHALVFRGWDVPVRSGEQLAEELRAAGLHVTRIRREGLPVIVVARREE